MKQQILRSLPLTLTAIALIVASAASAQAQKNDRVLNRPSSAGVPSAQSQSHTITHSTPPLADSISDGVKARKIITGFPQDQGFGNCFPFGCAYDGEYQQVYTHS